MELKKVAKRVCVEWRGEWEKERRSVARSQGRDSRAFLSKRPREEGTVHSQRDLPTAVDTTSDWNSWQTFEAQASLLVPDELDST